MLLSIQMRLMGECRGSIDAVKRAEGELTEDEDDMPGLTNPTSTDTQGKGQWYTNTHTHTNLQYIISSQMISSCKPCMYCVKLIWLFPSRCDRALGADPGSVSEWETQAQAEPAAVAAADPRPADHEGLVGSVWGWTQPAARAWAQHRHTHHPAENQEAQGLFTACLCQDKT